MEWAIITNYEKQRATDTTAMSHNEAARQVTTASVRLIDQSNDPGRAIILHYHHEKRFHSSKRDLYKLYYDTFTKQTSHAIGVNH